MKNIVKGGPCSCAPDRYVRFVIPPGVPGCHPVISCRGAHDVGKSSIREHAPPRDMVYGVHIPVFSP